MPRLVGFQKLRNLTAAQERGCIDRADWEAVRHLIGVLQPSYEASTAMQSSSMTVAEAFKLVCRLHRTMRVLSYPCPINFTEPLAVGRDAILSFLDADNGGTNAMELDGRLFEHEQVYTTRTRSAATLCPEAATFVSPIQEELNKRFFNTEDKTKKWLKNEAVLAATLVTPGGGSMLRKVAARAGHGNPTARARAAIETTCSFLKLDTPDVTTRDGELESERKKCRTTLVGWDSEESRTGGDESPADLAMQELERFVTTSEPSDVDGALSFWAERRDEYPLLHLVACSLFGASGSSAASEQDFSVAGLVLRKDRSTLLPEHLEMHCLARFNAQLLPSDLSRIPHMSQAARTCARCDMQPLPSDPRSGGMSAVISSESESDTFLDESEFDESD